MGRRRRRQLGEKLALDAPVVIIGAGLAGLSAAIALEQRGFHNITIFEKNADFMGTQRSNQGYGLTLTYDPRGVLAQLVVLEELARLDCPSRSHYTFRHDGTILGYYGNAFCNSSAGVGRGQRGNLRVPRLDVRRVLRRKLQHARVQWQHKLVRWTETFDQIQLWFANGNIAHAHLLLAADGVRSATLQCYQETIGRSTALLLSAPRSLGIGLILGRSLHFKHEIVHERGFYTLGNGMRLFVMPYAAPSALRPNVPHEFMWQLSFADPADNIREWSPATLLAFAQDRCKDWHNPILAMLQSTPLDTMWGTVLVDRDPTNLLTLCCSRLAVLGDAAHAMSPFKGQGANQALHDGPLLASWLVSANASSAIAGFTREMVQRTAPAVQASRRAAEYWHHDAAIQMEAKFANVADQHAPSLRFELRRRGIMATTHDLDGHVQLVLLDTGLRSSTTGAGKQTNSASRMDVPAAVYEHALQMAESGNLAALRVLSWKKYDLRSMTSTNRTRCVLRKAIAHDHVEVVHWLVIEAGCDLPLDATGELTPQMRLLLDMLTTSFSGKDIA